MRPASRGQASRRAETNDVEPDSGCWNDTAAGDCGQRSNQSVAHATSVNAEGGEGCDSPLVGSGGGCPGQSPTGWVISNCHCDDNASDYGTRVIRNPHGYRGRDHLTTRGLRWLLHESQIGARNSTNHNAE